MKNVKNFLNCFNNKIDESILHQMENFGYTREYLLKCIHNRELSYTTAAYFLLLNSENEN